MARIAPDANDVLVIMLDDPLGTTTHVNTGTAGSAGNFLDYGSPISGAAGPLGSAMYIPSAYLVNARNGAGGANDLAVMPHVSLSGWIFIRRSVNYAAVLFNKQYFLNGWSSPWLTFGFQMHSSGDQCDLYLTVGGVLQATLRTPTTYPMPIGRWIHIGGTYNGSVMNFYVNGSLAATGNYTGAIDYGSPPRGQWYVGGIPGTGVNQDPPIIVQDIRVADVARPQSYFQEIAFNGLYVNG